jgi:hypothetical protein
MTDRHGSKEIAPPAIEARLDKRSGKRLDEHSDWVLACPTQVHSGKTSNMPPLYRDAWSAQRTLIESVCGKTR